MTNKANAHKNDYESNTDKPALLSFPGGAARPHEARRFARSLASVLVYEKLTDVAAGRLPPGKFPPLGDDEVQQVGR